MKPSHKSGNAILVPAALLVAGALAACSEKHVAPPSQPAPTPTLAPAVPPLPRPEPRIDWRDAPITPGDWQWSMAGRLSTARFGDGELELRCDRAAGQVTILRRGVAQGPVPVTIVTSTTSRVLTGTREGSAIAVSLAARDGLLDAMAFSRGRFAVEVDGLPALYVPSWPEVSRVVEDCR